jgi:methylated-DNA-[protein]-cysteine S-methyltransferase
MAEMLATCNTELDYIAFVHNGPKLMRLSFGHPTEAAAASAVGGLGLPVSTAPFAERLRKRLIRFAEGEAVDFESVPVDLSHLTPFGQRVIAACRAIPLGEVRTYGQLAAECGKPGAARAVGSVMAKNRTPLITPCHRVVPAGGKLGGFSAPQGVRMKERLLKLEGALWWSRRSELSLK